MPITTKEIVGEWCSEPVEIPAGSDIQIHDFWPGQTFEPDEEMVISIIKTDTEFRRRVLVTWKQVMDVLG